MDVKIIDLLKKLKSLADQGVGGEKENAQDMLQRLMAKHGITPEMIEQDEKRKRVFEGIKDGIFKKLFFQIVGSVIGGDFSYYEYTHQKRNKKKDYAIIVTDSEFIEITSRYQFYLPKFNEDLEIFYNAFVQKNKLYTKSLGDKKDNPKELSEKELENVRKMIRMMDGLGEHQFNKRLENGQ